jgi:hypothetical protein
MKVRLTKKLAECIDGVDLSDSHVGDVLDLSEAEARLLIAEQWAEVIDHGDDTGRMWAPHDKMRRAS